MQGSADRLPCSIACPRRDVKPIPPLFHRNQKIVVLHIICLQVLSVLYNLLPFFWSIPPILFRFSPTLCPPDALHFCLLHGFFLKSPESPSGISAPRKAGIPCCADTFLNCPQVFCAGIRTALQETPSVSVKLHRPVYHAASSHRGRDKIRISPSASPSRSCTAVCARPLQQLGADRLAKKRASENWA